MGGYEVNRMTLRKGSLLRNRVLKDQREDEKN